MRIFILFCAPLILGCANKGLVRFDKISKQAAGQDFLGAAHQIRNNPALYGSEGTLLRHLDLGLLYHYAGHYDSSVIFLRKAVKIHEDLFSKSITNEAVSLLINDNVRPYRGRPYEITWLHLILAFDYLAQGNLDDARVEIRQAQIFLDAVAHNAGAGEYRDDGLFRFISALIYEALGEKDDALISLYKAVKAYRNGKTAVPPSLARYAQAALTAGGRENDVLELELPVPDAAATAPDRGDGEIVVVGEMGRSPSLGESVFWGTWVRDGVLVYHYRDEHGNTVTDALPAPGLPPREYDDRQRNRGNGQKRRSRKTQSGTTFHVKWAMPALRDTRSESLLLRVSGDSGPAHGETFADTRDLLQNDLEQNRAANLTRTVIRVLVRTLAAQEAKDEMSGGNPLVNLFFNIGTDILGDQLEQADVRLWFLLPRTIQIARIPVKPGRYHLDLGAENASGRIVRSEMRTVDVKAGEKKFLFFTSLK